jgi:hypothetical protein
MVAITYEEFEESGGSMKNNQSRVAKWLTAFGRFWWDFLVGDTPEIFVAVIAILVVIQAIRGAGHNNALAVTALPVLVVVTMAISIRRAIVNIRKK